MDPLSDILDTARLRSVVYFCTRFDPPWELDIPPGKVAQFHLVVDGRCQIHIPSEATVRSPICLEAGDVAVFIHGTAHRLIPFPDDSAAEVSTSLLCGHFEFDHAVLHPFLAELPALVHVPAIDVSWAIQMSDHVIQETSSDEPGSSAMAVRLSEAMLVEVLRHYARNATGERGFFSGLRDETVYRALRVIHDGGALGLSLQEIAGKAGLSRSTLASSFKRAMGKTVYTYISEVRMMRARNLLLYSAMTQADIADKCGYSSEAAFIRAFKRITGTTPGSVRRQPES